MSFRFKNALTLLISLWETVNEKSSYGERIDSLINIVLKYSPKSMFFYTTPWDVVGYEGFAVFENIITRYLIDLTDHAYSIIK